MSYTETMATTFNSKCRILGELWSEFKDEEDWVEFCDKNDMGLPLAFVLDMQLVDNPSPLARSFIEQSFSLLLAQLQLEDTGWESLDDMFDKAEEKKIDSVL